MPTYTQAGRMLAVHTPLEEDLLILTGLRGPERISSLFRFELDLLAETNAAIPFDRLLGAPMTVELHQPDGNIRYFNGIVQVFEQRERDEVFAAYRAELVPNLWLLTRKVRSRIFQQLTIPEILRQLFAGLKVTYDLAGQYHPRDYCVQYRESDFDFASRLMEEEGIYYFFQHTDRNHQLVVTDISHQHPTLPGQSTIPYEEMTADVREEMRVVSWRKRQELRAGQYTLRDYCFEMPSTRLEAHAHTDESVTVGKVVHKLHVGGNDQLEIYEHPGCYAQRFDGMAPHGALRAKDLTQIFPDGDRTVKLRMEEEQAAAIEIQGRGDCPNFAPGYKFTLEKHFDGDGPYVLTAVEHDARQNGYRSGEEVVFHYENRFTCVPADVRYRPPRRTSKPAIGSVQTATVTGPEGQEVFVDKYGRIKVQFHWDREGKNDANSSCWVRVAQIWAGNRWGAFFWPRIGHEVVVAFEEGDPDQPVVIGSLYNGLNLPPLLLPQTNMFCGIKSASVRGKANENYNSLVFVDLKGHEHLAIHSERHMVVNTEFDVLARSGRHHGERVAATRQVTVGGAPASGGSGGGTNPNTNNTIAGSIWAQPVPQAVLGLNSSVTYGSNFQASFPQNFQLAAGGLFQLVYDPVGLAQAFQQNISPTLAMILGSGVTGNVQVTVGSNIAITLGMAYEVQIGPAKMEIHSSEKPGARALNLVMGIIIGVLSAVFMLVYAPLPTDEDRAILAGIYEAAMQVSVAVMISYDQLFYLQTTEEDARAQALHNGTPPSDVDQSHLATVENVLTSVGAAICGFGAWQALIMVPVFEAQGESQLHPLVESANQDAAQEAAEH